MCRARVHYTEGPLSDGVPSPTSSSLFWDVSRTVEGTGRAQGTIMWRDHGGKRSDHVAQARGTEHDYVARSHVWASWGLKRCQWQFFGSKITSEFTILEAPSSGRRGRALQLHLCMRDKMFDLQECAASFSKAMEEALYSASLRLEQVCRAQIFRPQTF